ncbi:predicted protein, partial [Nematostella vectensis]
GAKIVGYPIMAGSQYIGMKRIAQELAARGHEVTLLVSSIQKFTPTEGITHAVYQVPVNKSFIENLVSRTIKSGFKALYGKNSVGAAQEMFCKATLDATDIIDPMKKSDLIITDSSMMCGAVLAEYLNITRVDYCSIAPSLSTMYQYHGPSFPAYIPQLMSGNPARMNFLQRVKNTFNYVAGQLIARVVMFPKFDEIKQRYGINPESSFAEAIGKAQMVLFLYDPAIGYAFPLLPGHKLIGPVNIQPPRPLSSEFQQIVKKSDGVIIVSFGSNVAAIANKEVDVLTEAFGRLKETVFWRQKGKRYIPANLSPNIKTVEWLPQNDLLANEKTRLFVSHLGQNSLYESGYRGIPLVGVPLWGDQFDNAVLVKDKGLGLVVDIHTVTADEFYRAIRRVIDEPGFKENAARISRLMRDRRRSPTQEAADWIEYTLRHGNLTHLRPASVHLTWYQYFLLDVMLFMGVVLLSVAMVIRLVFKLICWFCCRKQTKTKTQ